MASRKYQVGDTVFVRYGLTPYHEFGEYHYPKEHPYVPGEEFIISAYKRGSEYEVVGKPVILHDGLIDHERTRREGNPKMVKGKYYVVIDNMAKGRNGKDFTMIGMCTREGGRDKDGNYRSYANYVTPSQTSYTKDGSWCYKNKDIRYFRQATIREQRWVDYCASREKFIPFDQFVEIEKQEYEEKQKLEQKAKLRSFPQSGWCPTYNETVLKFLSKKSDKNMIRECKNKDYSGFAWQQYNGMRWNVWPVRGQSSKRKYDVNELLDVVDPPAKNNKELKAIKEIPFADPDGKIMLDLETGSVDWWNRATAQIQGRKEREIQRHTEERVKLYDPYNHMMEYLNTPPPVIDLAKSELSKIKDYQLDYDRLTAQAMALLGSTTQTKKDEFTQQKPVVMKSKKKRRKLISC